MVNNWMPHLRVVAVNLLYSVNLGYIARVMKNFGFLDLYLVKVEPEIIEGSLKFCAHSHDIIQKAKIVKSLDSALEDSEMVVGTTAIRAKSKNNLLRTCITPPEFVELYHRRKRVVTLLLGRESTGLTNEELKMCDVLINIPANPSYPTLNVSHAATVLLYEIYTKKNFKHVSGDVIHREDLHYICKTFSELCEAIKMPSYRRSIAGNALKNILARASPTSREASTLMSPLRKAVNSLKRVK